MKKAEDAMNVLMNKGFIKNKGNGEFSAVESYDEHQQLLAMM